LLTYTPYTTTHPQPPIIGIYKLSHIHSTLHYLKDKRYAAFLLNFPGQLRKTSYGLPEWYIPQAEADEAEITVQSLTCDKDAQYSFFLNCHIAVLYSSVATFYKSFYK